MSYMCHVLAKDGDPTKGLKMMVAPVEWRDKRFVATGELQDRYSPLDDLLSALEGEDTYATDYPMEELPLPEGWSLLTRFWVPELGIPPSDEVRLHAAREAMEHLIQKGVYTRAEAEAFWKKYYE